MNDLEARVLATSGQAFFEEITLSAGAPLPGFTLSSSAPLLGCIASASTPLEGITFSASTSEQRLFFGCDLDKASTSPLSNNSTLRVVAEAISKSLRRDADVRAPSSVLDGFEAYSVPNWDAEDAVAVSQQTIATAKELLESLGFYRQPDAAPSADGSIGLEWWNGGSHFFIDIGPGVEVFGYLKLTDHNPVEEHFLWGEPRLLPFLRDCYSRLWRGAADHGGIWWRSLVNYVDTAASGLAIPLGPKTYGLGPLHWNLTSQKDAFTTAPWVAGPFPRPLGQPKPVGSPRFLGAFDLALETPKASSSTARAEFAFSG